MDVISIGQKVRELRAQQNLSMEALAIKARVHRNTVSNLELGAVESVTLATLSGIAAALGVALSDLISDAVSGAGAS